MPPIAAVTGALLLTAVCCVEATAVVAVAAAVGGAVLTAVAAAVGGAVLTAVACAVGGATPWCGCTVGEYIADAASGDVTGNPSDGSTMLAAMGNGDTAGVVGSPTP